MFTQLEMLAQRPELFDQFDTAALWTDPHVAGQMLTLHLDSATELASRPHDQIAAMTEWISRDVPMAGKKLLDLGCGPGLYAAHFQQFGAQVTGLDISESSIAYARNQNIPDAEFVTGSYHDADLPECDITTLIYGDICAMPQAKRMALFQRIHAALSEGGHFILDCFAPSSMTNYEEGAQFASNLDNGFWAAEPYFGFKQTFLYPDETTVLDKYLIVEPQRTRFVHNWLQFMTPDQLSAELQDAGFEVGPPKDVVSGNAYNVDDSVFVLIAAKA